jgi:CRISPR-associated protein Csb2
MAALFPSGQALELRPADGSWHMVLQPDESLKPRSALLPRRWTGPARVWSSVTPVILDRHPKPHFRKDPLGWRESCMEILGGACARGGLPHPSHINVTPYSPLTGVPPAPEFKPPAPRHGRPARFHIHVTLCFDRHVLGPLLLGAGRFRGYGLFAPQGGRMTDVHEP